MKPIKYCSMSAKILACLCLSAGFSTTATAAPLAKCYDPWKAPVYPATTGKNSINSLPSAARFLNMATFGATPRDMFHLSKMSFKKWLDEQFALNASCHLDTLNQTQNNSARENRMEVWFRLSVTAPDQLRQRVAFALSELFVVSDVGSGIPTNAMAVYYDILVRNAFGNFHDILEQVTLSPAMGRYLAMLGNQKPTKNIRADENYAREIMQLFTIGLVKLDINGEPLLKNGNPIPTYAQEDVEGLARLFTGWSFGDSLTFTDGGDWRISMRPFSFYHDKTEKTILTHKVVPAGNTPDQDLAMALNTIFKHPNVAPFVSQRLIQRLVTSNPSPKYIARVAAKFNDNGKGVRGDMKAVIQAILLDPEALNGRKANPNFGKLREPLLVLTHLWRAFDGSSSNNFNLPYYYPDNSIGQAPLSAPSVFNFFSPEYAPSRVFTNRGLVAPEFQLVNEASITQFQNTLYSLIEWSYKRKTSVSLSNVQININSLRQRAKKPGDLVGYLDLILTGRQLPADVQAVLENYLRSVYMNSGDLKGVARSVDALYLVMSSPYYLIQR